MTESVPFDVTWASAGEPADVVIVQALTALLGPGPVRSGRLCPECGGSDHGNPWAEHSGRRIPVSVARAGGWLLVALAPGAAAVGVDVAQDPGGWDDVAREAVLKADGRGTSEAPAAEVLAAFDGEVHAVPTPFGFQAAVALRR